MPNNYGLPQKNAVITYKFGVFEIFVVYFVFAYFYFTYVMLDGINMQKLF